MSESSFEGLLDAMVTARESYTLPQPKNKYILTQQFVDSIRLVAPEGFDFDKWVEEYVEILKPLDAYDMRKPGEKFCSDCPDHEACSQGYPCHMVLNLNSPCKES